MSSHAVSVSRPTPPRRKRRPRWARWSDARLLDLRLCDLDVTIEGSALEARIAELHQELAARGIDFRPHYWLSDEWFTPDGVTGIAIPFYLADPRLAALERAQLLEVEGGTPGSCLRILRHEMAHVIDNAYHLRRRRRRRQLFGSPSQPYPEHYAPKPYSKSFVLHLDSWYAQSHPDEDFAETFAVWLDPNSQWRQRYADWPALKKLEYVDRLMREIVHKPPLVATRRIVDPISRLRRTLRWHYRRKRRRYGLDHPQFYDRDLRRLFSDDPAHADRPPAAVLLRRVRASVRRDVARWTSARQYAIDRVLADMIDRCDALDLHLTGSEGQATADFTVLLTVQTMNFLHSGRHRLAL